MADSTKQRICYPHPLQWKFFDLNRFYDSVQQTLPISACFKSFQLNKNTSQKTPKSFALSLLPSKNKNQEYKIKT